MVDVLRRQSPSTMREEPMHLLARLQIERSRLRWTHLLPELDGSSHHAIDGLGECRSGLVDGDVQEAYRLAARLLLTVLPANAADTEPGDLVAAKAREQPHKRQSFDHGRRVEVPVTTYLQVVRLRQVLIREVETGP